MVTSPGTIFAEKTLAKDNGDLDTIDLRTKNSLFAGRVIYLVVQVNKALVGAGTVNVKVQQSSSSTSGFSDVPGFNVTIPATAAIGTTLVESVPKAKIGRYLKGVKTKTGSVTDGEFYAYLSAWQPGDIDDTLLPGVL